MSASESASNFDLRALSDRSLVSRLNTLVRRESDSTLDVLLHLGEVERRRLYRNYGCASMFTYCTQRLCYSASAAARRLRTARAIRRYPRTLELLTRREVNLTTVHMVAGIVFERNDPSLFERIRGRTQNEVEAIVAAYRPKKRLRDRVQAVYVARDNMAERSTRLLGEKAIPSAAARDETARTQPGRDACGDLPGASDGASSAATTADAHRRIDTVPAEAGNGQSQSRRESSDDLNPCRCRSTGADRVEILGTGTGETKKPATAVNQRHDPQRIVKRYKYQFTVSEDLKQSIDRVRALLSFRIPSNAPMEDVLSILVEEYLDRHCPERRHTRREVKKTVKPPTPEEPAAPGQQAESTTRGTSRKRPDHAGQKGRTKPPTPEGPAAGATCGTHVKRGQDTHAGGRHIPPAVRDAVMARAGGMCSFIGEGGERCTETHCLQIDHIIPVALGGSSAPDNLRVLCAAHNILEAERVLGKELMAHYRRPENPVVIRETGPGYRPAPQ